MTTADLALWLADHTDSIACDEAAGDMYRGIRNAVDAIERMINRPFPDQILGPCPTVLTNNYGEKPCRTQLSAPHGQTWVQCPECKASYEVKEIVERRLEESDGMSFTISELWKLILPVQRLYVPLRTLQHWAARGKLVPTGYDAEAEPKYLLADVRELWAARPQQRATGATAHERNRRKAG